MVLSLMFTKKILIFINNYHTTEKVILSTNVILLNKGKFINSRFSIAGMSSTPQTSDPNPKNIFPLCECHRFIKQCMEKIGTPPAHAEALAENLTEADHRGHFSHGMNRLEMYVDDIKKGVCNPKALPSILSQGPATAWVDGNNTIGVVTANFCMDLAIKKAKDVGFAMVTAKGSNHFGIAGLYSSKALKQGLIGLSFTNTSPVVVPTRAGKEFFGTNPISCAAPGLDSDSFELDMSTSAVAMGKLEMLKRKNQPIPTNWATPDEKLYPLGGLELTSGYKGYGLGLMVEIFCSILSGATYGPNVRMMARDYDRPADIGHCFIAIDPGRFAPGFEGRLEDLMQGIRRMEPVEMDKPVLIPGDLAREHKKLVELQGGVVYVDDMVKTCQRLAEQLNIKPMEPL